MKFGIVTDSSCDLPESYTMKEDVTVVSFYVSFDGENYLKEGKEAVKLRNQDVDLETAVEALKKIRHTGQIFFTTKDLKYLEHGGRIGKAACLAGSMLNIKPILRFCDAELGSTELCRGSRSNDWCTYRPLSYGTGNFEKM